MINKNKGWCSFSKFCRFLIGFLSVFIYIPLAANAQAPAPKLPNSQAFSLASDAFDTPINYYVFLPPNYDETSSQKYPVVYWLHGSNGSPKIASSIVSRLFHGAMVQGKIPEFIIVFPDGLKQSMWVDSKDGLVPMESFLVKELIPHIDTNFPTVSSRRARIVEGGSMGGYGAARLTLKYPDIFAAGSMLSAGPMQPKLDPSNAPIVGRANAEQVLNKVYGGDQDYFYAQSPWYLATQVSKADKNRIILRQMTGNKDSVYHFNVRFAEHIKKLGINIQSSELEGVDHNPQKLFKALSATEGYWAFFDSIFSDLDADGTTGSELLKRPK